VEVDEEFFLKYVGNNEDELKGSCFRAQIANEIPGYERTIGIAAEMRIGRAKDRPSVRVTDRSHTLAGEQEKGISMARVHEIVEECFPWMLNQQ
jgi:hypothetical protein